MADLRTVSRLGEHTGHATIGVVRVRHVGGLRGRLLLGGRFA
jgi:hypothetical protein